MNRPSRNGLLASLALAGLISTTGCATNPATGKPQLSLYSEAQEIQMGSAADQDIVRQSGLYDDDELARYVDEVGQTMAARSERPGLPWTFRVLDDPVVNAFALPGGYIYVTRGILAHLSSEAELAAVLGHEVGHVTARHGVNRLSKAQLANIGLGIGSIAAPEVARVAGGLAQQSLQLLFLKYSRDDERQADDLGFRYSGDAGYPGGAFVDVFQVLGGTSRLAGGTRLPGYLATHPDPDARLATAQQRMAGLPPEQRNAPWRRDAYLDRIDDIPFGANPRQGFFRGRTFYHPELKVQLDLPAGWTANNQRDSVVAISPDQDALVQLTLTSGDSVAAAANEFYGQQGMTIRNNWRSDRRGLPLAATRQFLTGAEPDQLQGTAGFTRFEGRTYRVLGLTRADRWGRNEQTLQEALDSFAEITDRDALNSEGMKIDLVKIDRAMTLEDFNRRYPSSISLAHLALINHVEPGGRLESGQRVKRVTGEDPGAQTGVELTDR